MRLLFSCVPASGHFHTVVPLAVAARDAGHAFATAEEMRLQIERLSLGFFPAGQPTRTLLAGGLAEQFRAVTDMYERQAFSRRWLHAGLRVESQLPGVLAAAEAWRPDVIVRDSLELAACLAAERLTIPHATVEVWAVGGRIYRREAIAEPLNSWRTQLGLAPDPDLAMLDRYLTFVPFPPSFRPPGDAVPATAHYLRPGVFSTSGDELLPAWMETLPAQPIVHMTLGTVQNFRDSALTAAIQGLADQPVTLVITTGRDRDAANLGPLPANVHVERYIPHSLLLPRCDLVISHAGAGTVTAAFWYGLPQIAVPLADDQFADADMIVRLGAGEQLAVDERTPERFAGVVKQVLSTPRYREAAAGISKEMRTLPPIESGVQLLERLAREHQPLPGSAR